MCALIRNRTIILVLLAVFVFGGNLVGSPPVYALQTYHVTNRQDSGPGSLRDCIQQSETDGDASRIVFDVRGGTIYLRQRFNLTAGNLTICATSVPPPGITLDFQNKSIGFNVSSDDNRFCNLRIINTYTNKDGILITGSDNVVERCSFAYCRDEAVGISGSGARNNTVAFCRIEHCGSQYPVFTDGRGILITVGGSGIVAGSYIATSRSGIMANTNSFVDFRGNLVEDNLTNYGVGLSSGSGNFIDNVVRNNVSSELQIDTGATFYRSGNTIDPPGDIYIAGDCTEENAPIVVPDTPFPGWLAGVTAPSSADEVGMGTGSCQCGYSISGTVSVDYPGWTQSTVPILYQVRNPGLPPTEPLDERLLTVSVVPGYPASGDFTIMGVPDGSYDVALKHYNHIADMAAGVAVSGADVTGLGFSLWAGDADGDDSYFTVYPQDPSGDNDVDLLDYYILFYQYQGGLPLTTGRNGDFDGDGNLDLLDYYGLFYGYQNAASLGNWYLSGNQSPVADAGPDQLVCQDDTVTFDGSDSYDHLDDVELIYGWNFGDGATGTGATVTHTYTATGTYTVTLTVNDSVLSDEDVCLAEVVVKYYYVNGTTGDDTNPGTETDPWKTIGKASQTMVPGQITIIASGTYAEGGLSPANSGSAGRPITFEAASPGEVTLNASGKSHGFTFNGDSYIVISGLEIINATENGIDMYTADARNNTIKNCIIHANNRSGIYSTDTPPENEVINCLIYNNKWWGIYDIAGEIRNCTIYGNGTYFIYDYEGIYQPNVAATISDCIVTNNDGYGISAGSDTTVTYSDVWNNGLGEYYGGVSAGVGCISSDPLFVDPASGDFHLDTGSPCIGTASDSGDMGYRYP